MGETLELTCHFPVPPHRLYHAWLDNQEHSQFTGSPAEIDPRVGGVFTAWDGYIQGKTLQLEPPHLIVQSWRTTDFPSSSPDSLLEVHLQASGGGTLLRLKHTNIPEGQAQDYRQGWEDYYFSPMLAYFTSSENPSPPLS